jgi:asparagine synthase (glutamine-hydrolysing)
MAHSLEVREPLMDHELVEWAATLPSACKLRGGNGKAIFKKAMEPHLPHDVLYRPKMGFSVPLARWFRGPLKERVRSALLQGALAQSGYLDATVVRELLDQHQAGSHDHSIPLWSLTMFDAFLRRVGGDTPAMAPVDAARREMPAAA